MYRFVGVASLFALWVALFAPASALAQTVDDAGLWWAFFGQGDLHDEECTDLPLKWWFDGHARFLDDADGFNQSIVRPGVGVSLGERSAIWAGYGWIRTSPLTGSDFDEHRIWQQWTWSDTHEPITFALRSRLEQRLIETGDDTGWRFRQLVRAQHNLPRFPRLILVAWDELFVHLNDTDWGAERGFNQNRVFVGLGVKCDRPSSLRTEVGYLNQTIKVSGGANRSHHILSVNIYFSP